MIRTSKKVCKKKQMMRAVYGRIWWLGKFQNLARDVFAV